MNKEEFLKKAKENKENDELHFKLIEYYLCDRENAGYSKDLKTFADRQVVEDNLLLSLMEYAEQYHLIKSAISQKRITLVHGTATVDKNCSKETIEALNQLSIRVYNSIETES